MNLSSITQVTTDKIANLAITDAKIANETISQSKIVSGYGFVPTGTIIAYAKNATPPGGWLQCNGAAVLISAYSDLAAAIYCGDALNATAEFGYKATSSAGTTRSTTGTYITLPDLRGIFIRGAGSQTISNTTYNKIFGLVERDSFQKHQHYGASLSFVGGSGGSKIYMNYVGGGYDRTIYSETYGTEGETATVAAPRVDIETRPANIALLYCIKF